jgi:hypothetical protein
MFLINLCPYPVKNHWFFYSWIGAIAVRAFGADQVCLLGTPTQLVPPSRQGHAPWTKGMGEWATDEEFAAAERITVPLELIRAGHDECRSGFELLRTVADRGFQAYRDWLRPRLAELHARRPIAAAITHVNDKALEEVCAQLGIPVIHHEAGSARRPFFRIMTMFFDFSGVNGRTEAAQRFAAAAPQIAPHAYPLPVLYRHLLSPEALALTRPDPARKPPGFEFGIALQVEDDSNLIVYSNGIDTGELLSRALHIFPSNLVLVRDHPLAKFRQGESGILGTRDTSRLQFEFLSKIKRLMTINSSVALESLALGLPTYVLGESPLGFMAQGTPDRHLRLPRRDAEATRLAMNFYLLGYLMPRECWMDQAYIRFRLGRPSELEIFRRHAAHHGLPVRGEPGGVSAHAASAKPMMRATGAASTPAMAAAPPAAGAAPKATTTAAAPGAQPMTDATVARPPAPGPSAEPLAAAAAKAAAEAPPPAAAGTGRAVPAPAAAASD